MVEARKTAQEGAMQEMIKSLKDSKYRIHLHSFDRKIAVSLIRFLQLFCVGINQFFPDTFRTC